MTQFHVLGAGAMGCLFASGLFKADAKVNLITRTASSAHVINTQDVMVDGINHAIKAVTVKEVVELECLLLCCKSHQTSVALSSVAHAITTNTQIIILQNGMGQHALARQLFPHNAIFAGLSTEGVTKLSTGSIKHAGAGVTTIGQLFGPPSLLPSILFNTHLTVCLDSNIEQAMWRKLAINAAINGLTVKYHCANGELIAQPKIYSDMVALCNDIDAIFLAEGIKLDHPVLTLATQVCQGTAQNISSMLQDIRNARATEFDFIYGFLLAKAKHHGLDVKYLTELAHDINPKEEPCV